MNIAPYKPALGPSPDETPKASANGSATIPAVNPPKKSPLKFEKRVFIFNNYLHTNKIEYFENKKRPVHFAPAFFISKLNLSQDDRSP